MRRHFGPVHHSVETTDRTEVHQQYGPNYRADLDLIFANPNGTPLKPDSVSATVSLLCKKLKLPKAVSLHTLRHSHGSHLLAAGMEITAVSGAPGTFLGPCDRGQILPRHPRPG